MDPKIIVTLIPAFASAIIPLSQLIRSLVHQVANNAIHLKTLDSFAVSLAIPGLGLGTYLGFQFTESRLLAFGFAWVVSCLLVASRLAARAKRLEAAERSRATDVLL